MSKRFFSAEGLWQNNGLALIRIVTGLLMAYHGLEVFERSKMAEYLKGTGRADVAEAADAIAESVQERMGG